ncbi:hypothetical protein XNC1_1781 [Xenorhabdus nematophila ATCC 19061]|uniref:Uncharacterized protein n=1 Tax=Xenorhabdus nematophila (strain ATCC 19061 / DSM 3370 / CCUG 14189 / LMG 1036 / NCIMB 9965 / AN6) TaxID=406817 RepID=D3VCX5_XENNA|nr:hypothetical protein XNC1_1781 [Xenorhabdus nematophila ATCC 19061]
MQTRLLPRPGRSVAVPKRTPQTVFGWSFSEQGIRHGFPVMPDATRRVGNLPHQHRIPYRFPSSTCSERNFCEEVPRRVSPINRVPLTIDIGVDAAVPEWTQTVWAGKSLEYRIVGTVAIT